MARTWFSRHPPAVVVSVRGDRAHAAARAGWRAARAVTVLR